MFRLSLDAVLFPYTTLFRSWRCVMEPENTHLLQNCFQRLQPTCGPMDGRSEEHTSELQSRVELVCSLLLEKKKKRRTECQDVCGTRLENSRNDHSTKERFIR